MQNFILNNLSTILISALLLLAVAAAILRLVRDKKAGKSFCGCSGCSGCAMQGMCHK